MINPVSFLVQEQEKLRSIEKKKEEVEKKSLDRKKEEVDEVQKLYVRLKQEQQRWDKECVARERLQVSLMLMFRVAHNLFRLTPFSLLSLVLMPWQLKKCVVVVLWHTKASSISFIYQLLIIPHPN